MDLLKSLFTIGFGVFSTENGIKACFVDNGMEGSTLEFRKVLGIHNLKLEGWISFLIMFNHLLDNNRYKVNVHDILKSIFEKFLTQLGITTSKNENIIVWFNQMALFQMN